MRKVLFFIVTLLAINSHVLAQSIDLEIVGIYPPTAPIDINEVNHLELQVNLNGNDLLPAASALIIISIPYNYLRWHTVNGVFNITDNCGNDWEVINIVQNGSSHVLNIQNKNAIQTYYGCGSISLPIIGVAEHSNLPINVNSSIVGVGVSDPNGNNQSVVAFMAVSNVVLPVNLTTFIAQEVECGTATLLWETKQEQGFSHFEIQASNDGKNYATIANVKSENSALGSKYSYTIAQEDKTKYYRLKIIDLDQKFEFSKVEKLVRHCNNIEISLSPNPAKENVVINNLTSNAKIEIYNVKGQLVNTQNVTKSHALIDLTQINAGNYLIKIIMNSGSIVTQKLIKVD